MKTIRIIAICLILSLQCFSQSTVTRMTGPFTLQSSVTKAASFAGTDQLGFQGFHDWIITLTITSAERDSADETYDFYITTGDGKSSWDIVHFPQIASTGAKTYTALVLGKTIPIATTTASDISLLTTTAIFKTDTAGADQGIKTLGASYVRHGAWGDRIGYQLVVAGTVATGIVYSITITPK